jgi:hypothetical protein
MTKMDGQSHHRIVVGINGQSARSPRCIGPHNRHISWDLS